MAPTPENPEAEPPEHSPVAVRKARRSLASRESAYVDEVSRFLDAGLELMVELGDERAPRVADIVERAGLSNQAFYRHFSGKEELIAAVAEAGVHRVESYLTRVVDEAPDPEAKVRAWILGVMEQAKRPAVAARTRATLGNLRRLSANAQEAVGTPRIIGMLASALEEAGSSDPERDANAIRLVVFGRLEQFLWSDVPTDDDVEHLVRFCLRAAALR